MFTPLICVAAMLAFIQQQTPVEPSQTSAPQDAAPTAPGAEKTTAAADSGYLLGPEDEITIRGVGIEEITTAPVQVDPSGYIRLPLVGQAKVSGLTVAEVQALLTERLKQYVLEPDISVSVTQFRSQPVSVLGAVRTPGVYQLHGRKTLLEVLSLAGGLERETAGSTVRISRKAQWGRIPLPGAREDSTGEFSVAEISLKQILDASNPAENIILLPGDVVTVPRADLVYVVGQVMRSGGFVLNERKSMTVLQALSLAGGLDRAASPKNAKILRSAPGGSDRTEISVDLKRILEGGGPDVELERDDILFVPSSVPKKAAIRAVEAAIQMGTGIVIWRR